MLGNFTSHRPTRRGRRRRPPASRRSRSTIAWRRPTASPRRCAFWYEWDWRAAEANYDRVLALNPGGAFTHSDHAWFLLNRLRFDEALREIAVAIDLDPLMPLFYGWSVGLHCAAGRRMHALRDFERAKQLDPNFGLPYFHAGIAYFLKGMPEMAIEVLRQGVQIARTQLGRGHDLDDQDPAEQPRGGGAHRGRDARRRAQDNISCMAVTWVTAVLGDLDGAYRWVERAIEERDTLVAFVHIYTPMLAPELASDPRYGALLARLELPAVAP